MGKKPVVVTLRVYKGATMSYDAQGNVQNENQTIKEIYDTVSWTNLKKNLIANGYIKVDVISAKYFQSVKQEDGMFKDVFEDYENIEAIKKEIADVYKTPEKPMTAEQKRIAELEAKLELLLNGTPKAKAEVKDVKQEPKIEAIQDAKVEEEGELTLAQMYSKETGKKPFHGWNDEQLKEKLEEFRASRIGVQ